MMGYANYPRKIFDLIPALLTTMLVSTLLACAAPPVQEMSNARQAIRAARDAGAAQVSPQSLADAESLLSQAETSLNQHAFRAARHYAVTARSRAVDALVEAQKQSSGAASH